MRAPGWAYLWPGLLRLWRDGDPSALLVALLFSLLVNLAIVSTFVWPELLAPPLRVLLWVIVSFSWLWFVLSAWLESMTGANKSDQVDMEDLFSLAQREYLRGNWYQVERLLNRLLSHSDQDLEARLLMASMLRTTRRYGEAKQQLRLLGRTERASNWKMEIEREWKLVEKKEVEIKEQEESLAEHQRPALLNRAEAA